MKKRKKPIEEKSHVRKKVKKEESDVPSCSTSGRDVKLSEKQLKNNTQVGVVEDVKLGTFRGNLTYSSSLMWILSIHFIYLSICSNFYPSIQSFNSSIYDCIHPSDPFYLFIPSIHPSLHSSPSFHPPIPTIYTVSIIPLNYSFHFTINSNNLAIHSNNSIPSSILTIHPF